MFFLKNKNKKIFNLTDLCKRTQGQFALKYVSLCPTYFTTNKLTFFTAKVVQQTN